MAGPIAQAPLSPTASSFTPNGYLKTGFPSNMSGIAYLTATSEPETPFTPNGTFALNSPPKHGPIAPGNPLKNVQPKHSEEHRSSLSYLAATSQPETPFTPNGSYAMNSPPRFGAIGQAIPAPAEIMYCQVGAFDKVNRNRAFMIEGAPKDLAYLTIVNLFDVSDFRFYSSNLDCGTN